MHDTEKEKGNRFCYICHSLIGNIATLDRHQSNVEKEVTDEIKTVPNGVTTINGFFKL